MVFTSFAIGTHSKCYAEARCQGAITGCCRAPSYGGIKALIGSAFRNGKPGFRV